MSNISTLFEYDDYKVTYCPACGERIEVDESDEPERLDDETDEYELWCPNEDCRCHFYANVNY